jgi:hypothetical protein
MVIKEVEQDHSYAKIIYSREKPVIGDQVVEIPKLGVDLTPYAHVLVDFLGLSSSNLDFGDGIDVAAGVRGSYVRGFYRVRPLAGLEVPVTQLASFTQIPLTIYGGGELNFWLGRLQLVPLAAIGFGVTFPLNDIDNFSFSHYGFLAQVNINYLIADMIRISAEAGYSHWFGNFTFGGVLIGFGVQVKL